MSGETALLTTNYEVAFAFLAGLVTGACLMVMLVAATISRRS